MRLLLALLLLGSSLTAQERTPSHCRALALDAAQVMRASWQDPVPSEQVLIHYIAHDSFLIRSHQGLNIVTDYTGFTGSAPLIPDVVTMNHAHETHWTPSPDPAIPHVLRGWGTAFGAGITHKLDLGEALIRNVSTDIRNGFSGAEPNGNSIFIFELAGLCIGHLGHLHQVPSAEQYAAIGRLDVVMVPVDGGYTLDLQSMMQIVTRLRSSIVIPMHWFSGFALEDFLKGMRDTFDVVELGGPSLLVSRDRLPSRPTIMVLRASWLTK